MLLKLNRPVFGLRKNPGNGSGIVVLLTPDIILEDLGVADGGDWRKVLARVREGKWPEGFLPTKHLVETEEPIPPEEIDLERFLDACTRASLVINASEPNVRYGVNRDYLVAAAWVDSGIRNIKSGESDAFGPFQLTPTSWTQFLDKAGGRDRGFNEGHFHDPYAQCYVAAQSTFDQTERLSKALSPTPEPVDGPYIPTGIEVYLAHLIGSEAAVEVLKSGNRKISIETPLAAVFNLGAGAVLTANAQFFKEEDGTSSQIDAVLARIETRLGKGFENAAPIVSAYRPGDEPVSQPAGSKAPWMVVAERELPKNIKQRGTPPHPDIINYFAETTLKLKHEDAWCAAFVSFCIAKSGVSEITSSNLRSARAADWMRWGTPLSHPRYGALAILSPLARGASGHVGFVTDTRAGAVELLGGNQGGALNKTFFPLHKVRSYRWVNWQTTASGRVGRGQPARFNDAMSDLIATMFADRGYARHHQIAAVANAKAESGLNPRLRNQQGEDSVGLFQLNRRGGLGTGRTVAELMVPETNIQIILDFADTVNAFKKTADIETAVDVFVRKIERPKYPDQAVQKRIQIARQLMARA